MAGEISLLPLLYCVKVASGVVRGESCWLMVCIGALLAETVVVFVA
jgi:hypothetical protein